jgi:hypothetical protein
MMEEYKEYITLHNKRFTVSDIHFIRELIKTEGHKGRTYLSKRICEHWNWRTPTGQLRDITCREILRKLESRGHIQLPPPLGASRRAGYQNKTQLTIQINTSSISGSLSALFPIRIDLVRGTGEESLYNGLIASYHYLGYHQGSGEQLKYIIRSGDRLLACIGFCGSAFKIADRDTFIGWTHEVRRVNLSKVVNNSRFLIFPWVEIYNLASWILGAISRRIRQDWLGYYNREIVLLETFVERQRFLGTCYKAANWLYLGQTQGRGRNDRHTQRLLPLKDIYVYPLFKDFRDRLQRREGE